MENVSATAVRVETVQVEEDRFDEARENREGWCPNCEDFTTPGVAVSVSGASCRSCFSDRVLGAVAAVHGGFIAVEREVLA